jgi:hypothetical protein
MEYKSINIRVRATGDDAEKILALLGETNLNVTVIAQEAPTKSEPRQVEVEPPALSGELELLETKVSDNGPFAEDRSRSRWDRGEEAILMRLMLDGASVEKVAGTLGRSVAAIKGRISRLGINFQKVRADRTDAILVDVDGEVTDISIKNPVLREFVHAFVEANRDDYDTMTACLEAAAKEAGCSTSTVKKIHYKKK